MNILLVTYDLKNTSKDYSQLYNTLKTAPSWRHHLEDAWLLLTPEAPQEWSERIRPLIDAADHFMVVDIKSKPRQGWLPKEVWEWIKHNEVEPEANQKKAVG